MTTTADMMSRTGSLIHQAKFVDVEGIQTRYYELGSGAPVVLCHGSNWEGQASANTWTLNLGGLAENFHVYAADTMGTGMTDNPARDDEYRIEVVVDHMYRFIRNAGLDGVHLVGQSRGGYLAGRIALEHPEIVKTLVVIDTATLAPEVGSYEARRAEILHDMPTDVKENIRVGWQRMSFNPAHVTDDYVDTAFFMQTQPKAQETERKMQSGLMKPWLEGLNRQKEESLQWIKDGRLTMPTLVYWGANDPAAILPQGLALFELVREHSPRAHMHVINHAGHFNYREYPEEWNRVVTNFIQSNL